MAPYIDKSARSIRYGYDARNAGELTFALTDRVLRFLGDQPDFRTYAEAIGALEATKLELYRRSVAPYENEKAEQNGDLPYPHRYRITNETEPVCEKCFGNHSTALHREPRGRSEIDVNAHGVDCDCPECDAEWKAWEDEQDRRPPNW